MSGIGSVQSTRWKSTALRRAFWETSRPMLQWLARRWRWPPWRAPAWGDLRRIDPIETRPGAAGRLSVHDSYERAFWGAHQSDVQGRALIVAPDPGGLGDWWRERSGAATQGPVRIDFQLARVDTDEAIRDLPGGPFDCVICSRAIGRIDDPGALVGALHAVLRPGGILLLTVAGMSRADADGGDSETLSWSLTSASARRLLERAFAAGRIEVRTYGNVLTVAAMLHGLPADCLGPEELGHVDPDYQVMVAARAVRDEASG